MREIFLFAWGYVSKYPMRLFLACTFLVSSSITEIVTPLVFGKLIDFFTKHAENPVVAIKGSVIYVGLFILLGVFFWIFRHLSFFLWFGVVSETIKKVVQDSTYKIQRFSTHWHNSTFSGSTVTKIKRGMRGYQRFIDLLYFNFIPLSLVIIGVVVLVIIKYAIFGIIIAIGTIIYAILSIHLSLKYVMPYNREENYHDTLLGGNLADIISCNATIKSFGTEDFEDNRIKKLLNSLGVASLTAWKRGEIANIIQNTYMTLYKCVFLFFALYLWYSGVFSVGDIVYSLSSYNMISGYLRNIGNQIRQLQQAANDMEDIVVFSKEEPGIKDKSKAKQLEITKGEIIFDSVYFKYEQQQNPIFKNFSLKIKPGECVAFVGHSGAGKSSLVSVLQRLYDIQKGSILIDGQDTKDVTIQSLRKNIVLIPQDPILFHRSIGENIAYGNQKALQEDIEKAATLAHAHEFIKNLPEGYNTLVGERGVKLSGGERQRIAIARAILADKKILLLDEATSSLDSISEKLIQDAIEDLIKDKTTIIIAHRLSTIKKANRIIVLDRGAIVEQGTHSELLKLKGKYAELWGHQVGGFIV